MSAALKLKPLLPSERISQYAVIDWWRYYAATLKIPEHLLFAIPNGAVLSGDATKRAMQMNSLKRGGLRPGVYDLFLAVPRHDWHGLFIEMKSENGAISEAQIKFASAVTEQGYATVVAYSSEQAIACVEVYLS